MCFEASGMHDTSSCGQCILICVIANNLTPAASVGATPISDEMNRYDTIFVNVAGRGADKHHFTDADILLNSIEQSDQAPPAFVAAYLDKSDRRAGLSPDIDVHSFLQSSLIINKSI